MTNDSSMTNNNPSTEELLGGSDDLVRLLLDSTGDGIYGTDLDGNCIFANPACLKLIGISNLEDVLGKNMHELMHHTRMDGTPYPVEECNIYRAFVQHGGTHIDDEIFWTADGSQFCAEYRSFPVEKEGELIGCVVTFSDITQRLEAEKQAQETARFVALLLESTGEGIYGTDLDGNCTFVNPAGLRILGFDTEAELIGKNLHNLVHHTRSNGEPYPIEECQIYMSFRQAAGTHVDDEVMWKQDGSSFPAEYWSFPIDNDDELIGSVVTFVDITKRREIEDELRQTEKMSAIGKLAAGLAHELNNPAAAATRSARQLDDVLGHLADATLGVAKASVADDEWLAFEQWRTKYDRDLEQALEIDPLDASDREFAITNWLDSKAFTDGWELAPTLVQLDLQVPQLEELGSKLSDPALVAVLTWWSKSQSARDLVNMVSQSTETISSLVNTVKAYSYMDQAPIQKIDVHAALSDTLRVLNHRMNTGISIVQEFDPELPWIETRGNELNQVWTNLIDNSIDALDGAGTVTITTSFDTGGVHVTIADTGRGIPEENMSKIFDPFFTTKDVGEGTGLGLDVARRIAVGRCQGEISVESQPGNTVFSVSLPLAVSV
jgi:PAS domain S-box-containing protein